MMLFHCHFSVHDELTALGGYQLSRGEMIDETAFRQLAPESRKDDFTKKPAQLHQKRPRVVFKCFCIIANHVGFQLF